MLNLTPDAADGTVLHFRNQTVTSSRFNLNLPETSIRYSATATQATLAPRTTATDPWDITVPTGYHGNVFVGGYGYLVPSTIPGGTHPVVWSGTYTGSVTGLTFQWKWAAAVYTQFDPVTPCVKLVDGDRFNPYHNADHAGTPECLKSYVIGGARGGGGSNWTGSYSPMASPVCH